jgi:hypothetical protein
LVANDGWVAGPVKAVSRRRRGPQASLYRTCHPAYSATEVDGWQRLSRVSQNRAAVHSGRLPPPGGRTRRSAPPGPAAPASYRVAPDRQGDLKKDWTPLAPARWQTSQREAAATRRPNPPKRPAGSRGAGELPGRPGPTGRSEKGLDPTPAIARVGFSRASPSNTRRSRTLLCASHITQNGPLEPRITADAGRWGSSIGPAAGSKESSPCFCSVIFFLRNYLVSVIHALPRAAAAGCARGGLRSRKI